jgi:hypothetical protein
MDVSITQYTVADFCAYLAAGEIAVNHEYQRGSKVWPPAARSFLIETLLMGYPIPKIYLSQLTDIKTRKTRKEIVDGQQRSGAIQDFYENKFKLRRSAVPEAAANKTYDELDDDLKHKFLNYSITADLLIGGTDADIREVFRRMNSYTIPLNAEEKRHAQYQGEFKWFIYRLTSSYSEALKQIGVFGEKSLTRMADAKLLTEIAHALIKGITTTRERELIKLYADNEESLPDGSLLKKRIEYGLDQLIALKSLHQTALMKPYHVYSLCLALAHSKHTVPCLKSTYQFASTRHPSDAVVSENLSRLVAALEDPENTPKKFAEFLNASDSKTNVAEQRKVRFKWFCRAIEGKLS